MVQIIKAYADIALLRRGPEDLPPSTLLFALTVAAYSFISLLYTLLEDVPSVGVGRLVVDVIYVIACYGGLLLAARRRERLLQTTTAIFGAGCIVMVVALPLILWLVNLDRQESLTGGDDGVASPLLVVAGLAWLGLQLWSISIAGHILRRALEWPYYAALGVAAAAYVGNYAVVVSLFPFDG